MTMYSFLIICDTNDPRNFHIECTSMRDYRLRFSAMKSHWNKRKTKTKTETKQCKTTTDYCRLFECNYTYYLLEKKSFTNVEDATSYRDNLIAERHERYKDFTPEDKLRVTFNHIVPELPEVKSF